MCVAYLVLSVSVVWQKSLPPCVFQEATLQDSALARAFPLSLTHTHTHMRTRTHAHTHTHTHTHTYILPPSPLFSPPHAHAHTLYHPLPCSPPHNPTMALPPPLRLFKPLPDNHHPSHYCGLCHGLLECKFALLPEAPSYLCLRKLASGTQRRPSLLYWQPELVWSALLCRCRERK